MIVRAELHCHNQHSNFHVGEDEPPYDSGVTILGQLERARQLGLDAVFVTNHNTLAGYDAMRTYARDHGRYASIGVYPAEEVTTDSGPTSSRTAYTPRYLPGCRYPRCWMR